MISTSPHSAPDASLNATAGTADDIGDRVEPPKKAGSTDIARNVAQNSGNADASAAIAAPNAASSSTHVAADRGDSTVPASGGFNPAVSPTFSPLYRQIKGLITQSLESGEWRPGDMIPSEVELAVRYRVSQGTVRKAIDELAADNLLLRRQGKGTFVATHSEDRVQFRFLRLLPDDGLIQPHISDVLECRRVRAPAEIARQLELRVAEPVVQIKRVLRFDKSMGLPANTAPVVFDEIWLPGAIFRGLTMERLTGYKGPFYAMFETEFGTRMIRASEKVRAVAATPVVAAVLGVDAGVPLLSVERLSYTYGDRPVEVRRGYYVTTEYHYQNDLS